MRKTTPILDRFSLAGLAISATLHAAALLALSYYAPATPARPPPTRRGEHAIRITLLPETRTVATPEPIAEEAAVLVRPEPSPALAGAERRPVSTEREPSPVILGPPPPPPPEPTKLAAAPPPRTEEVRKALRPEEASPRPPRPTVSPEPAPVSIEDPPRRSPPGLPEGASLLAELSPRYPRRCRRLGHEGTLRLEVEVGASGRVLSVRVVSSAGCEELDESAVAAVRSARFRPARHAGRPVRATVSLPVAFRLE